MNFIDFFKTFKTNTPALYGEIRSRQTARLVAVIKGANPLTCFFGESRKYLKVIIE